MVKQIMVEWIKRVKYFIKFNLRFFANLIIILTPFLSMWLVKLSYDFRGEFAIGSEILVPIILLVIARMLNEAANICKSGNKIPVPRKRFTEYDMDNGSVNIDPADLHELLVYTYELENWFESKGKL